MSRLVLATVTALLLGSMAIPAAFATALPIEDDEICNDQLGYLKPVSPDDIAGVTEQQRVWVTEYCPGRPILTSDGNASSVRRAIGSNDALVAALRQKGYFSSDVFAVVMMGEGAVNLYVHR